MLNISDVGTAVDGGIGFASAEQLVSHARCLWCGRTFMPRSTGGSTQKFCCTGHRQQFWIAARRWTMRAIEAGLLSVDCLRRPTRACTLPEGHSAAKPIPRCWSTSVKPEPTSPKGRKTAARVSNPSLNNFSPGNRAFGYRRVIALIGIAPIPNRRLRRTGIGV